MRGQDFQECGRVNGLITATKSPMAADNLLGPGPEQATRVDPVFCVKFRVGGGSESGSLTKARENYPTELDGAKLKRAPDAPLSERSPNAVHYRVHVTDASAPGLV